MVLQVLPELGLTGASRSVLVSAERSSQGGAFRHAVASLTPVAPHMKTLIGKIGLILVEAEAIKHVAAEADIVHAHYWNTPAFHDVWSEDWADTRLVLTCHVSGRAAPQLVPDQVLSLPHRLIATSSLSAAELGARRNGPVAIVHAAADFRRIQRVSPPQHGKGRIGVLGALETAKAHPDLLGLLPFNKGRPPVLIGGDGDMMPALRGAITTHGWSEFVELTGRVTDISGFLQRIDLLAHPLAKNSYATSEAVIHEAMFAGRPPVILAGRGPVDLIDDGETGFVASDESTFTDYVAQLASDPTRRVKMGLAAAAFARAKLGAGPITNQLDAIYTQMLDDPKRPVAPLPHREGANALLASFGPEANRLEEIMTNVAAGRVLSSEIPLQWVSAAGGGVLHFRRSWPQDPTLRLWAGHCLSRLGRPALAAMEFEAARKMGSSTFG
jgi:glycosyltransferase involved in cell wall biosynthesis